MSIKVEFHDGLWHTPTFPTLHATGLVIDIVGLFCGIAALGNEYTEDMCGQVRFFALFATRSLPITEKDIFYRVEVVSFHGIPLGCLTGLAPWY